VRNARCDWTCPPTRGNGVQLMPVYKGKNTSGKIVWRYKFQPPGAKRGTPPIRKSGFSTKQEAIDAEAARRLDEHRKHEAARNAATSVTAVPTTLKMLFEEFFREHAEKKLAAKTVERYREMASTLNPVLLEMPLKDINPLHLTREWNRLIEAGGHTRGTKTPRPLSEKTVRSIAGVVSSAFHRAIRWGLVEANPVSRSELPIPRKREGIALAPSDQTNLIETATGPWCFRVFLAMAAGMGARRGEVLALRWSDIKGGIAVITRSLSQTRAGLIFKGTKTNRPRRVELPPSVLARLEMHRGQQDEFRRQFGPDYSGEDLIFANPDGTPLKPDSISASVSRLCRKLRLPKGASLHTLRHTHGSYLLANGVDLATVSQRLGHSSVRVTADVYMHALPGRDGEAARIWDKFVIEKSGQREESKSVN
jgi:integrase